MTEIMNTELPLLFGLYKEKRELDRLEEERKRELEKKKR